MAARFAQLLDLGTTRADGRPHAKPVWGIWMDGAAIFSTSARSLSARNIARDAEAVIHLESGDRVAILEGRVERPSDPGLLEPLRGGL